MIRHGSALVLVVATLLVLLAGCGGGDSSPTGSGATGTGAAPPVLEGCANFDNWKCQRAGYQCFAHCEGQQIACDGYKCARATSSSSAAVCPDVTPERLPDCGDCHAAFDAGCK